MFSIEVIPYSNIDFKKWDHCIDNATHPIIYCNSIFLNTIAKRWDALVVGDYEIVMPIIYRSKFGISYLYQPAFLPFISIFTNQEVNSDITNAFIEKAFDLYSFAEIGLRLPPKINLSAEKFTAKICNNYTLNLKKDYQEIFQNYHPNFTKSLRRLQKLSLAYEASDNINFVIELYKRLYDAKIKSVSQDDILDFEKLCIALQKSKQVVVRLAKDRNEEIVAAVLLLKYNNRLYNMLSCITAEGKKAEANYFLYNELIKEFSGSVFTLDFEGSDIKGIANFYLKFNPTNEPYYFIKYNNLPRPIRWLK